MFVNEWNNSLFFLMLCIDPLQVGFHNVGIRVSNSISCRDWDGVNEYKPNSKDYDHLYLLFYKVILYVSSLPFTIMQNNDGSLKYTEKNKVGNTNEFLKCGIFYEQPSKSNIGPPLPE